MLGRFRFHRTMASKLERIRALNSPAEYIHDMMTDLGHPPEFTWQEIDDLLRVYYCTELQIVIAQQALEIEDLKDKIHILESNF